MKFGCSKVPNSHRLHHFVRKPRWHVRCGYSLLNNEERLVPPLKLSFVPLLLGAKALSSEAQTALRENRREDAAALLMQQYDLDCHEAGELVDVSVCDE